MRNVSGVSKCNQTWMTTKQTLKYGSVSECEALKPRLADQAGAYPGLRIAGTARSISATPGRDASPSPQFVRFRQQSAGTYLYSLMERCTVRVKCLAQEHNTVFPTAGPHDPGTTNNGLMT